MNEEHEQAALAVVQQELPTVKEIEKFAPGLFVRNAAEQQNAGNILLQIKAQITRLEALRTSWVSPLNEVVNRINAHFRPAVQALKNAETTVKVKLAMYDIETTKQREVQASTGFMVASAPPAETAQGLYRIHEKQRWRIIDESLVPRELCSPDDKKIEAWIRLNGLRNIAGLEYYVEKIVSAATGKGKKT